MESLNPTCVQNFRPLPPMVFEILGFKGFKLKNKNDKNWRNRLFAILYLPCLWSNFHQILDIDLHYLPVVSKVDYH